MLLETDKMHSTTVIYKKGSQFRLQFLLITVFFALLTIFFLILLHVSWYSSNTSEIAYTPKSNHYVRLPTNLQPIYYTLTLKIFLPYSRFYDFGTRNFTTEGDLRIDLVCLQTTSKIILNANKLNVKTTNVWVFNERDKQIGVTNLQRYRHETDDIWALEFQLERHMIANNNYSLFIKYNGLIDDVWNGGLYKVPYHSLNEQKMLAITQLQPTDASRLLPCFDEPEMKAKFSITVIHPAETTAISNALVRSIKKLDTIWKETSFEETPRMSTYLLAIAVSDFDNRQVDCGSVQEGHLIFPPNI